LADRSTPITCNIPEEVVNFSNFPQKARQTLTVYAGDYLLFLCQAVVRNKRGAFDAVLSCRGGAQSKSAFKQVCPSSNPNSPSREDRDWLSTKLPVLVFIVATFAEKHLVFQKILLFTGDAYIQASPYDKYCGIGFDISDPILGDT